MTSDDVTNPDGSTDDSTYTYNADGSSNSDGSARRRQVVVARRRKSIDYQ